MPSVPSPESVRMREPHHPSSQHRFSPSRMRRERVKLCVTVEKYQNRFSWLKDSKFIQDLENDSVDSELLDEELSALQEEEILTSRQKLVKCLQSNPVQILLCVVVLLDAGIVIAQILLDLHSVREKLHKREQDITHLLSYIKKTNTEGLRGYDGNDVKLILELLSEHSRWDDGLGDTERETSINRRHSPRHHNPRQHGDTSQNRTSVRLHQTTSGMRPHRSLRPANPVDKGGGTDGDIVGGAGGGGTKGGGGGGGVSRSTNHSTSLYSGGGTGGASLSGGGAVGYPQKVLPSGRVRGGAADLVHEFAHKKHGSSDAEEQAEYMQGFGVRTRRDKEVPDTNISQGVFPKKTRNNYVEQEEHDTLHEVAHGLHFASISLLGFLVIEDLVKIIAMGKEFFKHKIEIFDAIIITSSFAFDIIFLGGVTGEEGEKAAAVLVVLLLWRITRVIDGILITAKQRQEFRIRLQKRARRKAEKRIDLLEDEKHNRARQITLLKELCSKAGVTEDDIELCTPKRPRRVSNTLCALSSVARLSVSMTMSMSSGLFSMAEEDSEKSDEKDSSHNKYDKFLDPGGPSEEGGYSLELYKPERRHSLPVPGKMSDIEEESRSSMQGEDSDSPVNACGVRIIIEDEPSDTQSVDGQDTAQDTLLETGDGAMVNDRRISQFSEVHLLA